PCQHCGALARLLNFVGVFEDGGSSLQRPLKDLAVADDHTEQVVEVVRDSSGEPADGFHLVRHAELALEHPLLSDVFGEYFKISFILAGVVHDSASAAHAGPG